MYSTSSFGFFLGCYYKMIREKKVARHIKLQSRCFWSPKVVGAPTTLIQEAAIGPNDFTPESEHFFHGCSWLQGTGCNPKVQTYMISQGLPNIAKYFAYINKNSRMSHSLILSHVRGPLETRHLFKSFRDGNERKIFTFGGFFLLRKFPETAKQMKW